MTDELVGRLAALVRADCPEGWVRADLQVTVGYSHTLTILMPDRNHLQGRPSPDADPLLRELREADGGWAALRLVLDPPGSYTVHVKYDKESDDPAIRIADDLLFALPPGWQSAIVRADGGLVFPVTGGTFPWTPPTGMVPAGMECRIEHRGGFSMTRQTGP